MSTTDRHTPQNAPSGFDGAVLCDNCGESDSWVIYDSENPYSPAFYIECECGRRFGVVDG